jgi:DNA-binding MarR family transcriptional regulator
MTTSPLAPAQADAWAAFQRMRVRLTGAIGRDLARATGLSEADFEILVAVDEQADGLVRSLALRCGLEWEKSRLSHQLRRMETRGLLVRETCEEDGRGAVVRLTEQGRRLAGEARRHYDEAVHRHVVQALTDDQLAALHEISDALLRHVAAAPHR